MSETAGAAPDHGVVDGAPSTPPPLAATAAAPRLSPAEEARTLVAATNVAGAGASAGYAVAVVASRASSRADLMNERFIA